MKSRRIHLAAVAATVLLATAVVAAPHKISAAQAAKIALAKYHGKLVKAPKLEHEDGAWQYEVLVKVGKVTKEVNVNADSGKIGSVENTTPAEEAKEAKAEKMKGKGKPKKEKEEKDEKDEKDEKGEKGG